jgi:hypothetical protein
MTTTEEAPPTPPTEAEAHDALAKARADQAQNATEIETLRALAQNGQFVDPQQFATLKVSEELLALRVIFAESAHTEATERANRKRRDDWADNVRPTIEALDADAIKAANRFTDAARELVTAVKVREDAVDRFKGEASTVGESDRIEINTHSGVKIDWYPQSQRLYVYAA